MTLAVDATSADASGTTTTTVSHVGGSPDLAVVGVVWGGGSGTTISATYGGVAMTAVPGGDVTNGVNGFRVKTFYLLSPPSGTQNVVVTTSTSGNKGVATITFTGADQTTPIADVNTATQNGTNSSTRAVTTVAGDVAVFFWNGASGTAATPNTGDTEFADRNGGAGRLIATYETATGTSTTVGASQASASNWARVAFAVKQGSGTQTLTGVGGIDSSDIGSHTIINTQVIVAAAGIDTSAIGTHNLAYDQTIVAAAGIDSSAVGTPPLVTQETPIVGVGGVDTSAIGTPAIVPGNVDIVGVGGVDTSVIGTPTVTANTPITGVGGIDSSAVGTPSLAMQVIGVGGVDTSTIGQPTVVPGDVLVVGVGGVDTSAIGQPALAPGNVNIVGAGGVDTSLIPGGTIIIGGDVAASQAMRSRVSIMGI